MRITTAAIVVAAVSFSTIALSQTLSAVCKEAGVMTQKGRTEPIKTPVVVSVERVTESGIFDDVMLVYGYPDNYAAAREIAEYAKQKYKRDYRVQTVQP
jgi:hypothetical protein